MTDSALRFVIKGVALFVEWRLSSAPTGNRLADAHTFSFEDVATLYDHQDPRLLTTYQQRARVVSEQFTSRNRQILHAALRVYLQDIGASDKSLQTADRLLESNSVAVVTGQQSGLFGGPLYSIYKALSTVGIASRLEAELGIPVVPVFWVASEDHDWAEVNHAYVLDRYDEIRRIRLQSHVSPHKMVYHQPLTTSDAEAALFELREAVAEGPYLAELLTVLRGSFEEGLSLSLWFARLMAKLMDETGLVLLDPCLPELRALAAPVWKRVLENRDEIAEELARAYAEVDAFGFTPEVIRDELNSTLFFVQDGERYVLERSGASTLKVRTLTVDKSVDEWIDMADSNPTSFSSNVLCRPVVQDHILPTLAYIGGPSEVAYYPLSRGVFHALGRTLPPLLLRQRVTVVPPSVRRHMEKWHVQSDAVSSPLQLVEPMLRQHGKDELDALFAVLSAESEGRWQGIASRFSAYGPQAADIAIRQRKREVDGMERARRKLGRLIEHRHEDSVKQLRHIERWLWTDGHLQERRLCVIPFWAKFGVDWIQSLPRWDRYDEPGAVYLVDL